MFEYNTKQNPLKIREYGRNIQNLIEYVVTIADRQQRTEAAKIIIRIMAQSYPESQKQNGEMNDFWQKLWDHLFIISDYQLDVDAPYPKPEPKDYIEKNISYNYKKPKIRYRTYGRNMEQVIQTVAQIEEPARTEIGKILANFLKKMYLQYNRDSVNDQLILSQLEELSCGKIKLPEDFKLMNTKTVLQDVQLANLLSKSANEKKKKRKKKKTTQSQQTNFNQNPASKVQ
jgi:hypothetical protein